MVIIRYNINIVLWVFYCFLFENCVGYKNLMCNDKCDVNIKKKESKMFMKLCENNVWKFLNFKINYLENVIDIIYFVINLNMNYLKLKIENMKLLRKRMISRWFIRSNEGYMVWDNKVRNFREKKICELKVLYVRKCIVY